MAAYVSRSQGGSTASLSSVSTVATSNTAGNLLVALIQWGSTSVNFSSISDVAGNNNWTQVGTDFALAGTSKLRMMYCWNCLGSAVNVVTVNLDANSSYRTIAVYEFSAVRTTTDPVNGNNEGSNSSGTTPTTGTITLGSAGEHVIVANFATNDGSNLSNATYNLTCYAITGDAGTYYADGYHITSSSEAATATKASNNAWMAQGAAFAAYIPPSVRHTRTFPLGMQKRLSRRLVRAA